MRNKRLSIALALAVCLSLTVTAQAAAVFSDVPANYWAYAEIQKCCEQGIVNGYSNGSFKPGNTVTGAHFAAMLTRMFYPEELAANDSLSSQGWYMPALTAAAEKGLLNGTSRLAAGRSDNWNTSANLPLNRYDMAQMLNNILVEKGVAASDSAQVSARSDIKDWSDISSQYRSAVQNCYALGVLNGTSTGAFSGGSSMNRAQACAVINRLANQTGSGETSTGAEAPAQTPTQEAKTPEQLSAEVVTLVNQERAKVGASPLDTLPALTAAAEIRAPEVAQLFEHTRPDGSRCFTALAEAGLTNYTGAGENIARGARTAENVMNMWMNSSGHKANILKKSYTHIGVAYYDGCWVQMFVTATAAADPTLTMSSASLRLEAGKTGTVKATLAGGSGTVTYTSSSADVAAVDNSGNVTAKKAGSAVITAAATVNGKQITATCTVTVTAAEPAAELKISPTTLSLEVGKTGTIKATLPSGIASISYGSSDTSVATVSISGTTGTVTARSAGTAVITAAITVNGQRVTASCDVTVTAAVQQAEAKTPEQLSAEIIELVNQERAKVGASPLGTLSNLTVAAEIRAPELARLFEHTRPDGRDCFTALDEANVRNWYTVGENIAACGGSAQTAMNMWMNSSGHKANILNKNFTHIGVAAYQASNGGYYFVQMFIGSTASSDGSSGQTPSTGTQTPSTGTQNPGTGAQTPGTGTQNSGTQNPGTSGIGRVPSASEVTCTDVPSDGFTSLYRESWDDGQHYFELKTEGDTIYLNGCVELDDSYYNYSLLDVFGYNNYDCERFVSGQPFSLSTKVDMTDFSKFYQEEGPVSTICAFICHDYTPGDSAYGGFTFPSRADLYLALDDSGNLTLYKK